MNPAPAPASESPPLFELGNIVATPAAYRALQLAQTDPLHLLRRHVTGDWQSLDPADQQANRDAIGRELRILSSYQLADGVKVWVITEADRSSTCILLPDEY